MQQAASIQYDDLDAKKAMTDFDDISKQNTENRF